TAPLPLPKRPMRPHAWPVIGLDPQKRRYGRSTGHAVVVVEPLELPVPVGLADRAGDPRSTVAVAGAGRLVEARAGADVPAALEGHGVPEAGRHARCGTPVAGSGPGERAGRRDRIGREAG